MMRSLCNTVSLRRLACLAVTLCGVTSGSIASAVGDNEFTTRQLDFFESHIRPVLIERCFECHSGGKKQKGGLNLSFRQGLLRGGETGPAIVPGKPMESLLIEALRYESLEMPPSGKLPDRVIVNFVTWIKMGAPDPRKSGSEPHKEKGAIDASQLWSLQPIKVVERPSLEGVDHPIDRFIRSRLRKEETPPANPAKPRILSRRLHLKLTGLPPESDPLAEYRTEELVDRLLGSPEFGEHWARHWLDLTGYADTIGVGRAIPALEAWRYRDYVINAFNSDKPFDEFIRQQIAGDIQVPSAPGVPRGPEPTSESITATGFLAIGPWELVGGDKVQLRMDVVDRQVNRVGKAFLGMTFECARCHAHKFDPVSHEDYFGLAGLFSSTITLNGRINGVFSAINQTTLPESPEELIARADRVRAFYAELKEETEQQNLANAKVSELNKQMESLKAGSDAADQIKELEQQRDAASAAAKRHTERINTLKFLKQHRTQSLALAVIDAPEPEDCFINIRGNAHQLGPLVPRGFPQNIAPTYKPSFTRGGSGRVQLAEWLTDKRNPLTARVWVNRVWHYLFGAGLVRSVDNFGSRGETPDHPELLDHLASEFMNDGWSTKRLIRRIVTSRTWQQSSINLAVYRGPGTERKAIEHDPDNRLLWRANRSRLQAESLRDSMLLVSGLLDTTRGGPSLPVDVPGNLSSGSTGSMRDESRMPDDLKFRRSIYLPQKRKGPFNELDFLGVFDLPDPNHESGYRTTTTVPTQALYLLNSPFVQECAAATARRAIEHKTDTNQRMTWVYMNILGRQPSDTEANDALNFVQELQQPAASDDSVQALTELDAWSRLSQTLLISNEFLFCD